MPDHGARRVGRDAGDYVVEPRRGVVGERPANGESHEVDAVRGGWSIEIWTNNTLNCIFLFERLHELAARESQEAGFTQPPG